MVYTIREVLVFEEVAMPVRNVSAKGSVVIPKALRQKYDMAPGTKVAFIDYGDGFSIAPLPADPIAAMRGMFAGKGSLTAELLAERRWERHKERRNPTRNE